jgi:hypothetical protein
MIRRAGDTEEEDGFRDGLNQALTARPQPNRAALVLGNGGRPCCSARGVNAEDMIKNGISSME